MSACASQRNDISCNTHKLWRTSWHEFSLLCRFRCSEALDDAQRTASMSDEQPNVPAIALPSNDVPQPVAIWHPVFLTWWANTESDETSLFWPNLTCAIQFQMKWLVVLFPVGLPWCVNQQPPTELNQPPPMFPHTGHPPNCYWATGCPVARRSVTCAGSFFHQAVGGLRSA